MKKQNRYKTVQLILFIIVAVVGLYRIFSDSEVYHQVAADSTMRLLCAILWLVLLLSFVFIFLDYTYFSSYKKDYKEMETAIHSDPMSGIANRFSCDMIIEQYLDKPLPKDMGCIMFDISNIQETNRLYGHVQGNTLIRDFSDILRVSAEDTCFVGRNGGNKFLALFEAGTEDQMQIFLDRIDQKVKNHNAQVNNHPIEYMYGKAFHEREDIGDITALISCANRRIRGSQRYPLA